MPPVRSLLRSTIGNYRHHPGERAACVCWWVVSSYRTLARSRLRLRTSDTLALALALLVAGEKQACEILTAFRERRSFFKGRQNRP